MVTGRASGLAAFTPQWLLGTHSADPT